MKQTPRMDTVRGVRQYSDGSAREYNHEAGHTKRDNGMRLCPECNLVWETFYNNNYGDKDVNYYPDFPRIGKPEKVCPKCKETFDSAQ